MPKNTKRFKNRKNGPRFNTTRPLLLKEEEGQEYAKAARMLGDRRVECECYDGKVRTGTIRGKMRKRQWVNMGDVVLVTLREFQDDKVDIIHVYQSDEVKKLTKMGHLPTEGGEEDDVDVVFEEEKEEVTDAIFAEI